MQTIETNYIVTMELTSYAVDCSTSRVQRRDLKQEHAFWGLDEKAVTTAKMTARCALYIGYYTLILSTALSGFDSERI